MSDTNTTTKIETAATDAAKAVPSKLSAFAAAHPKTLLIIWGVSLIVAFVVGFKV